MDYLLFAVGLVLLVYSGKYLVQSGVSIARHFNIPTLIIGITIIAFGTSAPELIVSIKAALTGSPEIAFGNVIGSNISNIGLVLAVTALIIPIPVGKTSWRVDWPVMMLASVLLYVFTLNNVLGFWESFALFALLITYLLYSVKTSTPVVLDEKNKNNKPQYKLWLSFVIVIAASVGLAYGADLLVNSAVNIASKLGVSKRVISITIVAFGTSLPELTASIIAALKKQTDISIGNIIGSNIFNIMAVLGITGMIHPIEIDHIAFSFDIIWMMFVSVLLFLFIFPFKTVYLNRVEGILLFLSYLLYLAAVIGGYDFESLSNTFHFALPWQ
ncbi:MAG: calcium/sodium antiporter [Bacteroidales bacterium]|nr:calcium/sodium antiporter [Bacteroidales bacterium]